MGPGGSWRNNDYYVQALFAGLSLSLRGTPIDGDSFVDVDDIGTHVDAVSPAGNNALLCLTGNTACCAGENLNGDWYFPMEPGWEV